MTEVKPYSTSIASLDLDNDGVEKDYELKFYEYESKSGNKGIVMISDSDFGFSFAPELKKIGKFNPNLTLGKKKVKGWYFRREDEKKMISLISKIGEGKVKPRIRQKKVVEEEKEVFKMLVALVEKIEKMDNVIYSLGEEDGIEHTMIVGDHDFVQEELDGRDYHYDLESSSTRLVICETVKEIEVSDSEDEY